MNMGTDQSKKDLKIGMLIFTDERNNSVAFLREYIDVFAWSYVDMLVLDTNIIVDRLQLIPGYKPLK
jgi:hypothetical protein